MRSTPQTPPHRRDRLGEGGLLCRVPGCRADRSVLGPDQRGRHQGHDGVEPKHTRRRAGHAPVTRLPGCCDASIGSGLCNGRLEPPALDEPGEELHRVAIQRRRQQRLWRKCASWIADEDPPNRHRWPARVIPDGGGGAAVDMTCCVAIPRGHGDHLPGRCGGGDERRERGIQAPAREHTRACAHGIEPFARRLGAIAHHHQLSGQQPAPYQLRHLACPIQQRWRPTTVDWVVPFRGG